MPQFAVNDGRFEPLRTAIQTLAAGDIIVVILMSGMNNYKVGGFIFPISKDYTLTVGSVDATFFLGYTFMFKDDTVDISVPYISKCAHTLTTLKRVDGAYDKVVLDKNQRRSLQGLVNKRVAVIFLQ